jgi:hypothetical protein
MTSSDLSLVLLTAALAWIVGASAAALVLCRRWRLDERRERLALKFDPVCTRGIERGDCDFRSLKVGGRQ